MGQERLGIKRSSLVSLIVIGLMLAACGRASSPDAGEAWSMSADVERALARLFVDDPDGECGLEVLALIEELMPDVAVVDCELPDIEGVDVAREIERLYPSVQVLALSAHDDERYVRGMLDAGAVGYLLKEEAPEAIVAAVRASATTQRYVGSIEFLDYV